MLSGAGKGTLYEGTESGHTYNYGTGASYGGEGGAGTSSRSSPYAYGSFNRPALFGSGGGNSGTLFCCIFNKLNPILT